MNEEKQQMNTVKPLHNVSQGIGGEICRTQEFLKSGYIIGVEKSKRPGRKFDRGGTSSHAGLL